MGNGSVVFLHFSLHNHRSWDLEELLVTCKCKVYLNGSICVIPQPLQTPPVLTYHSYFPQESFLSALDACNSEKCTLNCSLEVCRSCGCVLVIIVGVLIACHTENALQGVEIPCTCTLT